MKLMGTKEDRECECQAQSIVTFIIPEMLISRQQGLRSRI